MVAAWESELTESSLCIPGKSQLKILGNLHHNPTPGSPSRGLPFQVFPQGLVMDSSLSAQLWGLLEDGYRLENWEFSHGHRCCSWDDVRGPAESWIWEYSPKFSSLKGGTPRTAPVWIFPTGGEPQNPWNCMKAKKHWNSHISQCPGEPEGEFQWMETKRIIPQSSIQSFPSFIQQIHGETANKRSRQGNVNIPNVSLDCVPEVFQHFLAAGSQRKNPCKGKDFPANFRRGSAKRSNDGFLLLFLPRRLGTAPWISGNCRARQ